MASKSQTFSVSLNLLSKNFQNGVKAVQNSLNSLKMQFRNFAVGLGAGLGLTETIRNMVDSARKLDRAQTVLKNVSNGVEAYGKNQKFVMGLSEKYNQELTTLMDNYAKFHSAANQANMPLEQQEHIYESLTRAAAYFNLTAEDTNGVMLAITQMMSKGRVSSEELRRQLGERLSGTMGLAAKAMGVTNAQLEKMLKNGELLAVDLLPKLAVELNRVTQNLDVNTIEGFTNRLKNAFTNLTAKLNIGGMYKGILKGATNGLEYITNNLKKVAQAISLVLGSLAGRSMIDKAVTKWNGFFNTIDKQLTSQVKKVDRIKNQALALSKTSSIAIDTATLMPVGAVPTKQKEVKAYERLVVLAGDYKNEQEKLLVLQGLMNNKVGALGVKLLNAVKNLLKFVGLQLIYTGIAMAISAIITKLASWYREQKRIKNLIKETKDEFDEMANSLGGEDVELQQIQSKLNNKDLPDKEREDYLNRINVLLGLGKKEALTLADSEAKVNEVIEERLALLKKERQYQSAKQIVAKSQQRADELRETRKAKELEIAGYEEQKSAITGISQGEQSSRDTLDKLISNRRKEIDGIDKELVSLDKVIRDYGAVVAELGKDAHERENALGNTGTAELDDEVKVQYEKIQKEYNNKLRSLNGMLDAGILTQEDYDKALQDLTFSTLEDVYALNNINENTDAFAKALVSAAKAYLAIDKKEKEKKKIVDEYKEEMTKLSNQYKAGVITQEELAEAQYKLAEETVKSLAALGNLNEAAQDLADSFKKQKEFHANVAALDIENPALGQRDGTYDYKKQGSDIAEEYASLYREHETGLKDTIKFLDGLEPTDDIVERLSYLNEELERATANAETFEDALKLATVSEDIKDLQKELNEGVWNNFSNIADAADRLTKAVETVIETMEDPDATAWEKILTIFNAITQTVDTIMQSVQMITQLTEVFNKLKAAEQAYQAVQDANAAKDLANAATAVVASQAEATASGTASAAKLPFPANILAIAGVVAAIAAVFASLPKFANGGIVQGNSKSGDKILARVNSGEMILNKAQQASLFNMLNNSGGGSKTVELKVKGSDLVGVLKNYNNKIRG